MKICRNSPLLMPTSAPRDTAPRDTAPRDAVHFYQLYAQNVYYVYTIHYTFIMFIVIIVHIHKELSLPGSTNCSSHKTTAAQNEVARSYHSVRGLYFLAVAFASTIHTLTSIISWN